MSFPSKPLKIVVVDDQTLFRKGLIAQLSEYDGISITDEAANGEEALLSIEKSKPDVMLLDLQMPIMNGYETLEQLKQKKASVKVIVLSSFMEEWHILRAIKVGAVGFLSKNDEPNEVMLAIKSVTENGFYLKEDISMVTLRRVMMQKEFTPVFENDFVAFNNREIQILQLIALEYSNVEIANRFFLSERTIEDIRREMLRKTGAKNAVGLVVYAIKNGLINPDRIEDVSMD